MGKVLNITEAVTIALHSMIIIANDKSGQVNVNDISKAITSSKFHVAKVLQKLVKEGFLGSHRGPSGGFFLKVKPTDISMLEIYESIEGKITIAECPIDHEVCPFNNCVFDQLTIDMTQNFVDFLKSRTLEDYSNSQIKHRIIK
ncbi:MAG: Rrf2 family transcriptional regulator [Marinilabiliales bacterium]|nr:MAG: Rrf2 family transcriptional regulator [Marinilabiliales bacterium]